ncbi:MAG: hypothetical protein CMM93_08595 [Rickettsiales bacterium]|nr:hypothetical protein [Rickettsiales bacterium]
MPDRLVVYNHRHIAIIKAVAESKAFRIYVAWENKKAAAEGKWKYYESDGLYLEISPQAIKNTCDLGNEITKEQFEAI